MVCAILMALAISTAATVTGTPTYYRSSRSVGTYTTDPINGNKLSRRLVGGVNDEVSSKQMLEPRAKTQPQVPQDVGAASSSSQNQPGLHPAPVYDPKGKGVAVTSESSHQPGPITIPLENFQNENWCWRAIVKIKDIDFRLHVDTGAPDTIVYSEAAEEFERTGKPLGKILGRPVGAPVQEASTRSSTPSDVGSDAPLLDQEDTDYLGGETAEKVAIKMPLARDRQLRLAHRLYPLPSHGGYNVPSDPPQSFDILYGGDATRTGHSWGGGRGRVVIEDITIGGTPKALIVQGAHIGVFEELAKSETLGIFDGSLGLGSARFASTFQFGESPAKRPPKEKWVLGQRNWLEVHELERTNGKTPGIFTLDLISSNHEAIYNRKSTLTIGACLCEQKTSVLVDTEGSPGSWYLNPASQPGAGTGILKSGDAGSADTLKPFLIDNREYIIDSGASALILYEDQIHSYFEVTVKTALEKYKAKLEKDKHGDYYVPCHFELPDFTIPRTEPVIKIPGKLLSSVVEAPKGMNFPTGYCQTNLQVVPVPETDAGEGGSQHSGQGGSRSIQKRANPAKSRQGKVPAVNLRGAPYGPSTKLGIGILGAPFLMAFTACFEFAPDTGNGGPGGNSQASSHDRLHKRVDPTVGDRTSTGAGNTFGRFHYCSKQNFRALNSDPRSANSPNEQSVASQEVSETTGGSCSGCHDGCSGCLRGCNPC